MVKPIRDYSITAYEIQNLFRARLNQEQIYYTSLIIKTIAKYMVVDRDILEARAGEKIGLSYISNAVNWGLITELKYEDNQGEKDIFHFHLNTAGINFAQTEGFIINKLPLSADHHIKSRIVTFNKWALQEKYDLCGSTNSISNNFTYYIGSDEKYKKRIICYYENLIDEATLSKQILSNMNANKLDDSEVYKIADVYKRYSFQPIRCELTQIGNKSCGSEKSKVNNNI